MPGRSTSTVRLVLNSGARVGGAQKRRLAKAFPATVYEFLAAIEAGVVTTNWTDSAREKAESCGRPFVRTRVQDEDGYFFIVGRLEEVIVSGGTNVYPAEIEEVIAGLDTVREVAVVGVPDETWARA